MNYGINLNLHKCVQISMNEKGEIQFFQGEVVVDKASATYLGNTLHYKLDIRAEVFGKLSDVKRIWNKINYVFKQNRTNKDKYWKFTVLNAVILSKLVYGLETVQLTDALCRTVDAFYLRALRHILGLQPSFIDRTSTNKKILDEMANIVIACSKDKSKLQS